MDMNTIINAITPILVTVITGVLTWVGTKVSQLISAKLTADQQSKIKDAAKDAWFIVEEYFRLHPELKTSIESKIIMFAAEVRKKIPYVTDEELETLRQALAGEINKDKSVSSSTSTKVSDLPIQKVTAEQTDEKVTATVKYFAPDGTELQPVTKEASAPDKITQQTAQQAEVVVKYFTKDCIELQPINSGATAKAQ